MEIKNIKESRNLIEDIIKGSIADELGLETGDTYYQLMEQLSWI